MLSANYKTRTRLHIGNTRTDHTAADTTEHTQYSTTSPERHTHAQPHTRTATHIQQHIQQHHKHHTHIVSIVLQPQKELTRKRKSALGDRNRLRTTKHRIPATQAYVLQPNTSSKLQCKGRYRCITETCAVGNDKEQEACRFCAACRPEALGIRFVTQSRPFLALLISPQCSESE